MKISKRRLRAMNRLLAFTLPSGPIIDIPIQLIDSDDDEDTLHQIILVTPNWEIMRQYTDSLPSYVYEMTYSGLGISFHHRSRLFIKDE
jgi:hypothetical protein